LSKRISAVHVNSDILLDDELSDPAQEAKMLIESNKPVPDSIWVNNYNASVYQASRSDI